MSDPGILPAPFTTADQGTVAGETVAVRTSKRLTDWLGVVFPAASRAGATSYTPTVTGLTLGTGGTVTGSYIQIGKGLVVASFDLVLGTGFTMGDLQVTLPVAAQSARGVGGSATCRPSGSAEFQLGMMSLSGAAVRVRSLGTSGQLTSLSASVPAAWATGGWISGVAIYRPA